MNPINADAIWIPSLYHHVRVQTIVNNNERYEYLRLHTRVMHDKIGYSRFTDGHLKNIHELLFKSQAVGSYNSKSIIADVCNSKSL